MESLRQIFQTFGVTWPTFIAQLITVGLVYFILRKYAFGPIIGVLEERRKRIEEAQVNADKIKRELASAEVKYRQMLDEANAKGQKLIEEARKSSDSLAQRRQQEAINEAERIIAKAHTATQMEHDRALAELKKQVGRLVVETTAKVTGKILTPEDQQRINVETTQEVAA